MTERISVLGKGTHPSLLLGFFFFLQMQKGDFDICSSPRSVRQELEERLCEELGTQSTGVEVSIRVQASWFPRVTAAVPSEGEPPAGGLGEGSTYPDVHFGPVILLSLEELGRRVGGAAAPRLQQLPGSEQVTEAKI